jgi:hypothetical protein
VYHPTVVTGKPTPLATAVRGPNTDLDDLVEERPAFILDPSDPFEDVVISIVRMNRQKRADYALDQDPWSNFRFTAGVLHINPVDAAIHNVAQKLARLSALAANGRANEPKNEAITDTYLDLAVYAVIALGIHTHPSGRVVWETPQ